MELGKGKMRIKKWKELFSPFWTDFSGKEETGAFSVGTGVLEEEEAKFRGRLATEKVVFHLKCQV